LQHSMTSFGPDIKNIGAAMAGMDSSFIKEGVLIGFVFSFSLQYKTCGANNCFNFKVVFHLALDNNRLVALIL